MPDPRRPETDEPAPRRRRGLLWPVLSGCLVAALFAGFFATVVVPRALEYVVWDADQRRRARAWAPRVKAANRGAFHSEGKAIVAALEAYRAEHGTYPERLEDLAGCEPRWTDWRYERTAPDRARLRMGEYDLHWFAYTWTSERGWHYDA